jgi:hypothetical protein
MGETLHDTLEHTQGRFQASDSTFDNLGKTLEKHCTRSLDTNGEIPISKPWGGCSDEARRVQLGEGAAMQPADATIEAASRHGSGASAAGRPSQRRCSEAAGLAQQGGEAAMQGWGSRVAGYGCDRATR